MYQRNKRSENSTRGYTGTSQASPRYVCLQQTCAHSLAVFSLSCTRAYLCRAHCSNKSSPSPTNVQRKKRRGLAKQGPFPTAQKAVEGLVAAKNISTRINMSVFNRMMDPTWLKNSELQTMHDPDDDKVVEGPGADGKDVEGEGEYDEDEEEEEEEDGDGKDVDEYGY